MSRVKIEHRLGIQAPAEAIWAVLADIPAWRDWNPVYPRADGALRIGARLDLDLALPGQKRRVIRPTIVDWVPNEQIHWRLAMFGGLIRSIRYFEIEQLGPANCILSNGELFDGLLTRLIDRKTAKTIRAGFAELGEALRARVGAEHPTLPALPREGGDPDLSSSRALKNPGPRPSPGRAEI